MVTMAPQLTNLLNKHKNNSRKPLKHIFISIEGGQILSTIIFAFHRLNRTIATCTNNILQIFFNKNNLVL